MHVESVRTDKDRIRIELDETEAQHLLSFLLHAKFSDDVRLDVVGSPTMQTLLRGLMSARKELGFDRRDSPGWTMIHEEAKGISAPPSFEMIREELVEKMGETEGAKLLEEYLYPFTWVPRNYSPQ
ncbi:hypothetical protein [Altererythrobacter sp.]|uniref:hypothetical protein n=1 Tax=Altererythrobacter sp. TaxID=1872480 RepID=UPI003D0BA8D9